MIGNGAEFPVAPARAEDVPGLTELFLLLPPSYWMGQVPRSNLAAFLSFAIRSSRSVLLVSRLREGAALAGYALAISDVRRFWLEFALQNPALSQGIFVTQLRRSFDLRAKVVARAREGGTEDLPFFSWSESGPTAARIIGLLVREELAGKGVTMDLYFRLCEALKERGIAKVEEYMRPAGFSPSAQDFFRLCGWKIQKCRCQGYKLTKTLR